MGVKLLLDKAHVPGIRSYEVYRREGGYAAVEKALKMSPNNVVESKEKRSSWSRWCRIPIGNEMEFFGEA